MSSVSGVGTAGAITTSSKVNSDLLYKIMLKAASGKLDSVSDPAAAAITDTLNAQVESSDSAGSNIQNAVSMLQTSGSYLQSISSDLSDMKSLAVQANSGTLSEADKQNIDVQFKSLQDDVKQISSNYTASGQYNGVYLLQGGSESVQTGSDQGQTTQIQNPDLSIQNSSSVGNVDTYAYDSNNQLVGSSHTAVAWNDVINSYSGITASSSDAVGTIDRALDYVAKAASTNATQSQGLTNSYNSLLAYESNLTAASSQNSDVDMAKASTELATQQVKSQSSTAVQSQFNKSIQDLALQYAMLGRS